METGRVTDLEWQKCISQYPNLEVKELTDLRDRVDRPTQCDHVFHFLASSLDKEKSQEKVRGKTGFKAGTLFQVLRIDIHPTGEPRPLHIHGKIKNEGGLLYDRRMDDMEIFGQEGGSLTLITPPPLSGSHNSRLFMTSNNLSIKLKGQDGQLIMNEKISLDYSTNEYEDCKVDTYVGCGIILSVCYVAIPVAVYGRIHLKLFSKKFFRESSSEPVSFLNVYGNVTAKYRGTFGNYDGQEIVLFDKSSTEYQRIGVDSDNDLLQSKCWLAVPAYSVLELSVKLFEYGKGVPLLSETVQLEVRSFDASSQQFRVGDIMFSVAALWHSPTPKELELASPEEANFHPWKLKRHLSLSPSPAIEILSVFVGGREQTKALNLFGTIKFYIDEDYDSHIFKTENSFHQLPPNKSILQVSNNGSKKFEEDSSFMVKVNLKDRDDNFIVKGYFDWTSASLNSGYYKDRFLCSVIKGERGFIATHYMILSSAMKATLSMVYKDKTMESCDVPVWGSVFAQLGRFDFSTEYDKKYNRIQLFDRVVADLVQVEGVIPLERSSFFVPTSSSITISVDLFIGKEKFFETLEFGIGKDALTIERGDSSLCMMLKWIDV